MKVSKLVDEVNKEIRSEEEEIARGIIKVKLMEIQGMKAVLKQAEAQLDELLSMEVSDVVWSK